MMIFCCRESCWSDGGFVQGVQGVQGGVEGEGQGTDKSGCIVVPLSKEGETLRREQLCPAWVPLGR